ncbi:MAG: serine hydrolase [Candidatus Pedobacter colombiensis]|uniref:Serine hydrolase n=1 Tax=Candidatus Pedobacter colombiensis TaxID=3121371 RepID=A0AAJ6B7K0_9SPHI|nr:serine hydrolase domain-containing protein [Pedobacter sp.]WEK18153.1 MAG: serine hydrolase [Pedobacter sp.]
MKLTRTFTYLLKSSFTLVLVCFGLCLNAQTTSQKLDSWLNENTPDMGGRAVLMVYKNGKVVYTGSANSMSVGQKVTSRMIARKQGKTADLQDYTVNTRVQIASCSKWLSAALVMTFVDEGKLKTTDTIGKYLPVLSKNGKGGITLSECLSHTTGIKAPGLRESLQDMKDISSMDEAVAKIATLPMEGVPGKVFNYSNVGLQLAGAVIEKISGESFEQLFAERIAKPLDMKNTDFGHNKVSLPAGGAYSTAEDYLNFLVMILNKGTFKGKRLLSESSIKEMQINRITPDVKIAYSPAEAGAPGYGYGEWITSGSVTSPGLFGSYPVVDNTKGYAAFLVTFYLKNKGKQQRYEELKKLLDTI